MIGYKFRSTRPLRGATSIVEFNNSLHRISIHAPLAGRDRLTPYRSCIAMISIHAPLAGRDTVIASPEPCNKFRSTRPLRGATTSK